VGIQIPWEGAVLRGDGQPTVKYRDTAVSCAKMAEPTKMLFGLWTWVGPSKHVLGGVHTGSIWQIPLNCLCAAAMRPFYEITMTTCYKCRYIHKEVSEEADVY